MANDHRLPTRNGQIAGALSPVREREVEYMMKQQWISAWQLAAQSAWERRPSDLLQSLRRFFALINRLPISCRVQWKPASCNGKAHIVQWTTASCNGKAHIVQWKVDLHNNT